MKRQTAVRSRRLIQPDRRQKSLQLWKGRKTPTRQRSRRRKSLRQRKSRKRKIPQQKPDQSRRRKILQRKLNRSRKNRRQPDMSRRMPPLWTAPQRKRKRPYPRPPEKPAAQDVLSPECWMTRTAPRLPDLRRTHPDRKTVNRISPAKNTGSGFRSC